MVRDGESFSGLWPHSNPLRAVPAKSCVPTFLSYFFRKFPNAQSVYHAQRSLLQNRGTVTIYTTLLTACPPRTQIFATLIGIFSTGYTNSQ